MRSDSYSRLARSPVPVRVMLAVGAPLAAALAWGSYVAPRATARVPGYVRLAVELAVFGLAIAALFAAGPGGVAWVFAAAVAVSSVLTTAWRQRWYAQPRATRDA